MESLTSLNEVLYILLIFLSRRYEETLHRDLVWQSTSFVHTKYYDSYTLKHPHHITSAASPIVPHMWHWFQVPVTLDNLRPKP